MTPQVKPPKIKQPAPPSDFERKAHELVGRLIFNYSRLDLTLALFVAGCKGNEHRDSMLKKLAGNGSFKTKLDLVLLTVHLEYPEDADCMDIWEDWLKEADAFRITRNNFVHGRWGTNERLGLVTNVVGLPSNEVLPETTYTLTQLEEVVLRGQRIESMLSRLRFGKWRRDRWRKFHGHQ